MSTNNLNKPDASDANSDVSLTASHRTSEVTNIEKRRRMAKFGLAAPVLMTIASRPVFAARCLSNMMSGNLSNPNRGNCAKGRSPGGWGQPGGAIFSYSTTAAAWTAIGLNYGVLTSGAPPSQLTSYTGGTLMSGVPTALDRDSVAANVPLREVLGIDPSSRQLTRHLVAAYCNAKLSALPGSTFQYILTVEQVLKLATGAIMPPPPYTNLITFLDSTWT